LRKLQTTGKTSSRAGTALSGLGNAQPGVRLLVKELLAFDKLRFKSGRLSVSLVKTARKQLPEILVPENLLLPIFFYEPADIERLKFFIHQIPGMARRVCY